MMHGQKNIKFYAACFELYRSSSGLFPRDPRSVPRGSVVTIL